MTELVPNLHWIKGRISNCYLWIGEAGLALFDAGMPGDVETILNYISRIGRSPTHLFAILITHADIDHAGGAAALQARTGAAVYAGRETAALMVNGKSRPPAPGLVQSILGRFMTYKPIPESAVHPVDEGQMLPNLEDWLVLAAPGHTLDHHAFFNRRAGILLAGDALNTRHDRLNLSEKRVTADLAAARSTGRRLLRLTPAVIACGHGRPFHEHDAGDVLMLDRELA